jgi:H+-translocating NAD(P) transhydrogenase subunit beta
MRYAKSVVIVPGYGLAAAKAQQKLYDFVKLLRVSGVSVKFAIHPVAGRMPGQMDVLLAEAGVPYDMIFQLEDINPEFKTTDVALVIGANDVVNPAARTDKSSPSYGVQILDVDQAKKTYVVKRGEGKRYAGIVNALFYADDTDMVYGDASAVLAKMTEAVRGLSSKAARSAAEIPDLSQTEKRATPWPKKCRSPSSYNSGSHWRSRNGPYRRRDAARSWSRPRHAASATPTFTPQRAIGR